MTTNNKEDNEIVHPNFLESHQDMGPPGSGPGGVCDGCNRNVDAMYHQDYGVIHGKEIKKLCFDCDGGLEPDL